MAPVKTEKDKTLLERETSRLSKHERDQLRTWMKATPRQKLAWLEEAVRLFAKIKSAK
jgi:hypothetical protein